MARVWNASERLRLLKRHAVASGYLVLCMSEGSKVQGQVGAASWG